MSGVYRYGPSEFPADEEPTRPGGPQGIQYQSAVLVRAFKEATPTDRAWLMRVLDLAAWARENPR